MDLGLLLGNGVRWLLMATSLYTFSPIYTFAQTENDMVLVPPGKLIISTEHGTTEIFIDKFFMDRFEVTQERYEKIIGLDPNQRREIARGKTLGYLFFEPSTRTRLSFQSAMALIGGTSLGIADVSSSSVQKGESLSDTVRVMSGYTDVLVLRHPLDGSSRFSAEISQKPIINGGSGTEEHPTQAIQDLFTIKKEK